ncbi:MAG: iron-containing alcohol dehydrogenase [Treponema sp.]|jgi:alcohol dehydrogenase YqhD (iron-dependent ADH family)|nr:iron-containing alcohol dehydrogenase [Treponema sp.]
MHNFEYRNQTNVIFGKGTEQKVGEEMARYAKHVLLHHSGGHPVRSGLIDTIKRSLEKAGVTWIELTGVQPNPRLSLVYTGIALAKKESVEAVLAVGGGSAIDSAKGIALGAVDDGDVWDFYEKIRVPLTALPVATVLTIPAAGSESSISSVLTNEKGPWKKGVNYECIRPAFSILNPEFSYTLPPYQTACGIADMLAHVMERYFTAEQDHHVTDQLCEGTMRAIIHNGLTICRGDGKDYHARAEIMLAGTIAHNNMLSMGRPGDWASHLIEHTLSARYDIAHGAGLAIVFPAWMEYVIKREAARGVNPARFARFAAEVWGVDGAYYDCAQAALDGAFRMRTFFQAIGLPVSFADAKLPVEHIEELAAQAVWNGPVGGYMALDKSAVEAILRSAAGI